MRRRDDTGRVIAPAQKPESVSWRLGPQIVYWDLQTTCLLCVLYLSTSLPPRVFGHIPIDARSKKKPEAASAVSSPHAQGLLVWQRLETTGGEDRYTPETKKPS
jgi:hypothetical protein